MNYVPDAWVLIDTGQVVKVLAGWKGGYTVGDDWRLSSGVVSIKDEDDYYSIINHSGSEYHCYKHREGMIGVMLGIYDHLIKMGGKVVIGEKYES